MPFGIVIAGRPYRSPETPVGILPYYGALDWDAPRTEASILSLPFRGPRPEVTSDLFSITALGNDGYWYAYPKAYGQAEFRQYNASDVEIGLGPGGWDGALGDPIDPEKFGPAVVMVQGVEFYLYMSDWPNLGTLYWRTTPDPTPIPGR